MRETIAPRWPVPSATGGDRKSGRVPFKAYRMFSWSGLGFHVEEDRAGIADEAVGPACDDHGSDEAGKGTNPVPAENPREDEASDDEHRISRVRD